MLGVKTAALPASLRRTNQRTVISLLLRLGSASRADLAKAAGLSQPTAGKITSELLEMGILQEAGSSVELNPNSSGATTRLGRPGQLLRLDAKRARFLAIELGVSETQLSALPVAVQLQDNWACGFPTPKSPEAWLASLQTAARDFHPERLWGVLISVPGVVDEPGGRVLFSPNLHWLENINLPELVRTAWNCPTLLVQEIRALALGQLTAEPGGEDFLLIDFGQGVGGAVVLEGELFTHPIPLSGEFGHTPVAGNTRPCGCGALGCLETLVSEHGLVESFSAAMDAATHAGGSVSRVRGGPLPAAGTTRPKSGLHSVPSWEAFASHVNRVGLDPWLKDTLDATARVVAGALNVLGVRRLVITGRLTELPACLTYLSTEITKGAMWGRFGEIACQGAPHRRAAGLVAAGIDRLVLPNNDDVGAISPHLNSASAQ